MTVKSPSIPTLPKMRSDPSLSGAETGSSPLKDRRMLLETVAPGRIEYEYFGDSEPDAPEFVMLHEVFGSVALGKDFPERLACATRSRVVVYSQRGHSGAACSCRSCHSYAQRGGPVGPDLIP